MGENAQVLAQTEAPAAAHASRSDHVAAASGLSGLADGVREPVARYLRTFLASHDAMAGDIDVAGELAEFVLRGKFMRAALVAVGYHLAQPHPHRRGAAIPDDVVRCGAALELLHSALLIHDDVIDRSPTRRGEAAWHLALPQMVGVADEHLGASMAICAGNLGYFWAQEMLTDLDAAPKATARLNRLVAFSVASAGVGVMQELLLTAASDASERDIDRVYTNKTALYSCSLPLLAGAILAGADQRLQDRLQNIGRDLGCLFQLIDDELDLYGDAEVTGKPVGTDTREGRKTMFYSLLRDALSDDEWAEIAEWYGTERVTEEQLALLRHTIERVGVLAGFRERVRQLADECRAEIRSLRSPRAAREGLETFLDAIVGRHR